MSMKREINKPKFHYVYSLWFDQTKVDPAIKEELFLEINKIREYGDTIPADPKVRVYIGETFRKQERLSEHFHEPHNPNHPTYNYASRRMIRLLDSYDIEWQSEILNKFPYGTEVTDFEHHFFTIYANAGHPLTNMSRTLDSPTIPRLAQAETIEQYRAIKEQIRQEKLDNKRHKKHKVTRHSNRVLWPFPFPEEHREQVETELLEYLMDQVTTVDKYTQPSLMDIIEHLEENLWNERMFNSRAYSGEQLKALVKDVITGDLNKVKDDPHAGLMAHEIRGLYK